MIAGRASTLWERAAQRRRRSSRTEGVAVGCRSQVVQAAVGVIGAGSPKAPRSRWRLPDPTVVPVRASDGATLSVSVMGRRGPWIVLAHGWTNDATVWGVVADRLVRDGHRVVAFDQRDHGRSTGSGRGASLAQLADDLATVLGHVGVTSAVIAGHSMGGMAVQVLAADHPDVLVRHAHSLALISTACTGLGGSTPVERLSAQAVQWLVGLPLSGLLVVNPLIGPLLVRGSMGAKAPAEDLRQIGVVFAATVTAARRGFLRSIQAMDLSDAVTSIDLPVLVAVGSLDRLTPPGRSRQLVEAIPNAYLVTVPEAGHMLPIEAPDQIAFLLGELAAGRAPAQAGQAWEAQVVTSSSAGTADLSDRPRADGG